VIEALVLAVACGRPVASVRVALPAPIIARTGCGTYAIGTDGRVAPYRNNWSPAWAPHATARAAPGVWVAHPQGRLALYRDRRLLWRSRIRIASDEVFFHNGVIAIGEHGNAIRVRGPDGRLYRTLARGHGPVYDPVDSTVLLVDRSGAIVRTDGRRVWRLAGGFRASSWVQLLDGRMIDVTTGRKSVFLRADGSPLGVTAPLDEAAAAMGGVVALPKARGIVYVVNRGRHDSDPGVNSVYVARPHAKPRLLYKHRVARLSCGGYAGVSYAHGRILYVDNAGPLAILDPTGRLRPVDLTRSLRVLQPRRASRARLLADWRSNWR
jgi:hypothetical protein